MEELQTLKEAQARCRLLERFPYVVYYRFVRDTVRVLAVLHACRDPQTWVSRN